MKLLIIAGPYEADRLRKAAVSAGFETVAVEPGESLSGWITATRPDLIVMAPQILHADPGQALAKVRSVPRGRVPIFLVGDAADAPRMRGLADGFFVRPVSADLLLDRARFTLSPSSGSQVAGKPADPPERTEMGVGPPAAPTPTTTPGSGGAATAELARGGRTPVGPVGAHGLRAGQTLRPLVATSGAGASAPIAPRPQDTGALLAALDAGIDALLDAELDAVVASTPGRRADVPAQGEPEEEPEGEPGGEPFDVEPTAGFHPGLLAAAPSPPPPDPARARVLARYAPVETGDYFAVLGVPRDAGADEVARAHGAVLHDLAPEALGPDLFLALAHQIAAIRTVADEAARVLSDEPLRRRYESRIPAAGQSPTSLTRLSDDPSEPPLTRK